MHHAIPDRLGPEIVFADRQKDTAKGRMHNAQHDQEQDQA